MEFLGFIIRVIAEYLFEYFLGSIGFVVLKAITFGKYKYTFKESLDYPLIFFVDIVGIITLAILVYILVQL